MSEPGGESDQLIIGLDIGTTAVKVVAFGIGSPARYTASREYPLSQPQPGWQVQDPGRIVAAVIDALAECVAAVGAARVVGLSLSTAMHGLIGLDGDRRPLTPLLTWADGRAIEQSERLRESGLAAAAYRISGVPTHPMTPLTKLIWFGDHEPDLARRVRHWVGLKDHLLLELTGTLATELSSASGTGLLDRRTRLWSPILLDLAGITADQMSPILDTTATLSLRADVARATGLPVGLPVAVGAADGPLGNLGTGALTPGVVGLSIGTSGALRLAVDQPVLDPAGRLFSYALTPEVWVVGGAISNGGSALRWAGGVFGADLRASAEPGRSVDAELLALAEEVPAGSDGLILLPYLLAERAPLWDPTLAGAFLGVRHAHTRAHFVRATVEGVALQLSAILAGLTRIRPIDAVHATGGVFRSALWRQVLADALDRPLLVTDDAAGTALGAAALGLVSLGRAVDLDQAVQLLQPERPTDGGYLQPKQPEVYAALRADIPRRLRELREVGTLFASLDRLDEPLRSPLARRLPGAPGQARVQRSSMRPNFQTVMARIHAITNRPTIRKPTSPRSRAAIAASGPESMPSLSASTEINSIPPMTSATATDNPVIAML